MAVANTYYYDHAGRKISAWEQLTNGNNTPSIKTLLSKLVYNEIGQLMCIVLKKVYTFGD